MKFAILFHFLSVALFVRLCTGGFCSEKTRCRYTTRCGIFNWSRCTRYRVCYKQRCCSGYRGANCDIPICTASCLNGGTCIKPNTCACKTGFSTPRCYDTNECLDNKGGCHHICINTHGSFRCSCKQGYTLSSNSRTCVDRNECLYNKGGCHHICINTQGSFRCSCRQGYTLSSNSRTCVDINECTDGTHRCGQNCINTVGSYRCSCRQGYVLHPNGRSCTDVNECSSGRHNCNDTCHNTVGSYSCSCATGFILAADGFTCIDKNECLANNGGCQQVCTNSEGSSSCSCYPGYVLSANGESCEDIDECAINIDGCSQICNNTVGSFTCSCTEGYQADGKVCIDIDDCTSDSCKNAGSCIDEPNGFTCVCQNGYKGQFCETDINECDLLNGGCEDICTNEPGSYTCSCQGDRILGPDRKSCSGDGPDDDVFKRNNIARRLLPRGCATLLLTRCTDGNNIKVFLSSTSLWYQLISDSNVRFTLGIVFVEVNDLALPISLNGAEVIFNQGEFTILLGTNGSVPADGVPLPVTRTDDCLLVDFTATDIFEFVSSVSFFSSFLDSLIAALPPWLGFGSTPFSALDVSELKTDLVYGQDIDDVTWCEGAPVIASHLYSVFRFSSEFSLSLYGNAINISKPLNGRKFCLIVDICFEYGGSVFLMIPEESRDLLLEFDFFKKLEDSQGLSIKPRGVGLSVVKGVKVENQAGLRLWNGDTFFTNSVFDQADLWIGGDVIKESEFLSVKGSADMFVSVPSPITMLTAVFLDEWNLLTTLRASATPTLKFKLFKKEYEISFVDMATAKLDLYMSIGGTEPRQWCGEEANPPGVFLSSFLTVNPFQNVPILKDWLFNVPTTLFAFVTSDPASQITDDMQIDVKQYLNQIKHILDRFKTVFDEKVALFSEMLRNLTEEIINRLRNVLVVIESSIDDLIAGLLGGDIFAIDLIDLLSAVWSELRMLESDVTDFLDTTEHFIDNTKDDFSDFIKNETEFLKSNLDEAISEIRNQVIGAVTDYSGFGLKFTTSLNFLGLKIIGVDVELVYSVDSLFQCSRFEKVRQLFTGEKAARILGRLSRGMKLGFFLKLNVGVGIGGAFSIDSDKFLIQLNAYVNMLGIKITGDVFIGKTGLYFYLEANIWNLFLAQIDVSAEFGEEWYQIKFTVKGKFVANARKRRQIQTDSKNFQKGYVDSMQSFVKIIADEAEQKISQAQGYVSKARNALSKAQDWFDKKKDDVDKANKYFDNAVDALETAKDKLEAAKRPFEEAIKKLNDAQKKVDNICKIKQCSKVCIPGIKCDICKKKVWGATIKYPCCKFTKCMVKLPDPICEAANLVCKGIRAVAFVALEAAKLLVKAPLLALDAAKAFVSAAQFIVDKARIVLDVAKAVLDLAKVGLEAAKITLKAAEVGLEIVKRAIRVAAKIAQLVLKYGVKSIVDVRNCGFELVLSTTSPKVFDVSCEVNAFRLGWKKVGIRINFQKNYIIQSLWQAAKATINSLKKGLIGIVSGRRKREFDFESSSHFHTLLRKIRQADSDGDGVNSTATIPSSFIDVANETLGFDGNAGNDSDNRITIYKEKCKLYRTASNYLKKIFGLLYDIVNDTNAKVDSLSDLGAKLQNYTIEELKTKVGLRTAGVDVEYLIRTYNVTEDEIEEGLTEAKSNFENDNLIRELIATAEFSKNISESNKETIRSEQMLSSWAVAIENGTKVLFNKSQCEGFSDCIFYVVSTLYEIHQQEDYENIDRSKEIISNIENEILKVISNISDDLSISEIYDISDTILSSLEQLDLNIAFCKSPPSFTIEPQNTTVLLGGTVSLYCGAQSPDSDIQYSWYGDGELIQNETNQRLTIHNVSLDDDDYFECVVENAVVRLTSRRAYLTVVENVDGCSEHYQPQPGEPTKFLQYDNGVWVVRDCPLGTVYNSTSCVCDFGTTTTTTTTPNPDLGCWAHYQPQPGEPTKFLQYDNGVWVVRDCPLGTVYNSTSCVCDFGTTTTTTTTPNPDTGCSGDYKPHPDDREKYLQRNHNSWIVRTCPTGLVFSPTKCVCDWDTA